MAMAHKQSWTAIAVFTSMIAASYGFAQFSEVVYSREPVALSQTSPVNGRIYFAHGDMRSGEPDDINVDSPGGVETPLVLIADCGRETATDSDERRRYLGSCKILREIDPRLYRMEYRRDVAEPTVVVPERK
jgi:hypothetical protein